MLCHPSPFPRRRRVILAALGVLDRGVTLGVEITHDFTIRAKIMLKPFDAQLCAFWFWAELFPQQLDKSRTLCERLLSIAGRTNLRTIFFVWTWPNAEIVPPEQVI